ncbi:MAG: lipopolysaccharide biosynthesis protein, partial [Gammaproteobacteria bacterium]|nr:lipopolysaccharide biosynthesis protein [Gammaproteobacteria bacterium]
MEEDVKSAGDYLAALRRRKRQLVLPMVIIIIISIAVALGLPAVYRSSATILIEQQDIPADMVQSTITTFADQRIQIISQRVMTTNNLMEIIEKYGLYKDKLKKKTKEEVLGEMRGKDIEFDMMSAEMIDPRSGRPTAATIAFTLAFNSESPVLAQKVANELVSLYLNENLRSRKEKTAETSGFLKEESERLAKEIAELEEKLAIFKQTSKGSTPDLLGMNMQLMQRAEGDINNNLLKLQSLEQRKIYLESELAQIDPYTTIFSETGQRILGAEARLKARKAELITLQSTYSPDHPDIIKMRKEVAALEKEVGGTIDNSEMYLRLDKLKADLAISSEKYSKDHPDVKKIERAVTQLQKEIDESQGQTESKAAKKDHEPDNPAYIQ